MSLSAPDKERLVSAAFEAKTKAYNPYSKFRVGAALLTSDGEIIKGCNVENASYGGTICAERTAFVKAVSEGKKTFVGLAVTSDVASPISPCGICRQFIREFCAPDMPIYLVPAGKSEGTIKTDIASLLPLSFGPEDLQLPRESSA